MNDVLFEVSQLLSDTSGLILLDSPWIIRLDLYFGSFTNL